MDITPILNEPIDDRFKGIPFGWGPQSLEQIGQQGWNVLAQDLPFPLAILKQDVLTHNSLWMQRFVERTGAKISPHGKTTMAPQLYQQQFNDGAWGLTLATVSQVQVARRFGVKRILLANQLVGRQAINSVLDMLAADPDFDFYCLVDSVAGVNLLVEAVSKHECTRPLQVLVEGGVAGGRCGARSIDAAMEVARAVHAGRRHLALRGVEGFEGTINAGSTDATECAVADYVDFLTLIAETIEREGLFAEGEILLTAGGSAYYDIVVNGFKTAMLQRSFEVVIRGGCYLTQDSRFYRDFHQRLLERSDDARELGPGLKSALEVWSVVQSRPEPTRVILTMGRRDCSFDIDLPQIQKWFRPGLFESPQEMSAGHKVVGLNDQHAIVDVPEDSPWQVGDLVCCGISHPCTTFDKWQLLPTVDEDYNVVGAIRTFF